MDFTTENIQNFNVGLNATFLEVVKTSRFDPSIVAMIDDNDSWGEFFSIMSEVPDMELLMDERQIASIAESDYKIENFEYGNGVRIKRLDLENDKLKKYTKIIKALAEKAANVYCDRVIDLFKNGHKDKCYTGKSYFASNHPVSVGSKKTFSNIDVDTESDAPAYYFADCRKDYNMPFTLLDRTKPVMETDESDMFKRGWYYTGARAVVGYGYGMPHLMRKSNKPLTKDHVNASLLAGGSIKNDDGKVLDIEFDTIFIPQHWEAACAEIFGKEKDENGNNTLYNKLKVVVLKDLG